MSRRLSTGLAVVAALAIAPERRAGAEDAVIHGALERAADSHPARVSAAPGAWNAATVRRLAGFLRGERGAATEDDLGLLREELERPLALSVSGAVSLGNYQGGFLYYMLRHLVATRQLAREAGGLAGMDWTTAAPPSPISLVTGASSGSINAFVAAISSCQPPVRDPRQSLFWKVWVPVGFGQLMDDRHVEPDGLLSTQPIRDSIDEVNKAWTGHWAPDAACAVDVGLSATRISARQVAPLDGVNLWLPRQTEKLMFTMRGKAGTKPDLAPFFPPTDPTKDPQAALFLKLFPSIGPPGHALTLADVTALLSASSAFSGAFPPHVLTLTERDTGTTTTQLYTDGGVFDDRPAGLALNMQRWRLGREGEAKSRTRYLVQDPDVTAWVPAKPPEKAPQLNPSQRRFLSTWLPFVGDFLNAAFAVELMDAIEREPTLYAGLEIPPRQMPVAGAYLMEFLAFAETDFRVFDFFTGMVDAWQRLAESSLAFQVMAAVDGTPGLDSAPEFDCLLAWRLGKSGSALESACAAVGQADGQRPADPLLRPNLEALVHASVRTKKWSERLHPTTKDPSDEQMFLTALGEAPAPGRPPYHYRDLDYRGQPAEVDTVELAIRDLMQDVIERTTFNQQVGLGRFVVGGIGKAGANYYAYRAPKLFLGAGLVTDRGFELQGAWRLPWDHWRVPFVDLRLDAAFRVTNIHVARYNTETAYERWLAFTPMGAVHLTNELQLQHCAPDLQSALQIHFGGGWAIESIRTWNGPLLWRHGPEVVVGATLFQRLYFEGSLTFYLDDCAGNNACAHADPVATRYLPPVVDTGWGLRFALGYRVYTN